MQRTTSRTVLRAGAVGLGAVLGHAYAGPVGFTLGSYLVAAIVFGLKSNVDWMLRAHFFRSVMDSHRYFGLFGKEGLKLITEARPR
jgi:hypothetical protein